MAKLMQYYLQSVSLNGVEIPRSDVIESAYIEMLNFMGPVLMLQIRDTSQRVIDNLKVKMGSTLVATLGDAAGRYALFQETFYVVQAPYERDTVHIVAIVSSVQKLLTPAAQPRYYNQKQPSDIVRELAPGLIVNADSLSKVGTWHLNNGQKPAVLLKQIANDTGAKAWYAQKKINFKLNDSLLAQPASFTYEYNNPRAGFAFSKIRNINQDFAATATRQFRFMGWHETEGFKQTGDPSLPIKMVSDDDLGVLQNKHITIIPKLDAECSGNPGIMAGQVINVMLHRYDAENRVNESVPKTMVVERVTHFESRWTYLTRMILGVPYDPNEKDSSTGVSL